jgi:hypothetical protein
VLVVDVMFNWSSDEKSPKKATGELIARKMRKIKYRREKRVSNGPL